MKLWRAGDGECVMWGEGGGRGGECVMWEEGGGRGGECVMCGEGGARLFAGGT